METIRRAMSNPHSTPPLLGGLFALLLLLRNLWLYWQYSYAFYPDSNLYVHAGKEFFSRWNIPAVVMFPYPLLNAITRSSSSPALLMWTQIVFSSLAGGLLVFWLARSSRLLAGLVGVLLVADIAWGANTRALMTDGIFGTLHFWGIGLLFWHHQRRFQLPLWEAVLAGVFYGLAVCMRPSHIFLALLIPPVYGWLARSWKKALAVALGLVVIFLIVVLINWKGTQKFYVIASSGGYSGDFIAYPLMVNRLYSAGNGPASQTIYQYLNTCYPGMDYREVVDRSESMAIDTVNNMDFFVRQVFPCITEQKTIHSDTRNLFARAYVEALFRQPLPFVGMVVRESALFLNYNNPYVINWLLNPAQNYGCTNLTWCDQIGVSRDAISSSSALVQLYQKAATKILQIYLAPMGLLNRVFPENLTLSIMLSWWTVTILTLALSKGSVRILFAATSLVILYTTLVVVVGFGFTERYPAMLSPIQAVYSGVVWYTFARVGITFLCSRLFPNRTAA